jgi:hypothetical protein
MHTEAYPIVGVHLLVEENVLAGSRHYLFVLFFF